MSQRQALNLWRRAITTGVRRRGADLTSRQMAMLLTVYLTPPPHTVRGLAAGLKISKPAVSRGLDKLGKLELIRRQTDENDRRNVLVQHTVRGSVFLREFSELITTSAGQLDDGN